MSLEVQYQKNLDVTFIVDQTKAKEVAPKLVKLNEQDHLIKAWLQAKFVEDKGSYTVSETEKYKFLGLKNNRFGIQAEVIEK